MNEEQITVLQKALRELDERLEQSRKDQTSGSVMSSLEKDELRGDMHRVIELLRGTSATLTDAWVKYPDDVSGDTRIVDLRQFESLSVRARGVLEDAVYSTVDQLFDDKYGLCEDKQMAGETVESLYDKVRLAHNCGKTTSGEIIRWLRDIGFEGLSLRLPDGME